MRAFAAGLAILTACTVTTQSGPIWSAKLLTGAAPVAYCIDNAEVKIRGENPSLEQVARALWLERLATRAACRPGDRRLSLDVVGLHVAMRNGAFAPSNIPDRVPPQATMELSLSARAVVTLCADGARAALPLQHVTWLAYTADPYLAEERARAALSDLVARASQQVWAALPGLACDAAELATAATMPAAATDVTKGGPVDEFASTDTEAGR